MSKLTEDQQPLDQDQPIDEQPVANETTGQTQQSTADVTDDQAIDKAALLEAQLKRVAAEFENYRRRTEAERKQLIEMAQARTLLELTPVLDNFRRAADHLPEDLKSNNWATGVLYVEKQLEQIFEGFGLVRIKTTGQLFDPHRHEAISQEANEAAANTIIAEVESGYMLGDQVLKPAKVKVSAGKTE